MFASLSLFFLACNTETPTETEQVESFVPDDLSELLEPIRDDYDLPALGAAHLVQGQVAALGTVGLRSLDDTVEVTDGDRWHLGSCTKAMTATLVGVYVEEGLLSWETTLSTLFADLEDLHADYADVTVTQILAHRGGTWSNLGEHPTVWNALWEEGDPMEQRAWFVEQILTEEPEVTPGTTYLYSNSGYMVMGAALEALTGDSWEDMLAERVFAPLGMDECGYGAPATLGEVDQPWGHSTTGPVDAAEGAADNPPALGPAGTVHCSLESWAAFAAEHVSGAAGNGELLSADSYTLLHTSQGDDYSLGWIVTDRDWAGGLALTHSGSNTMWLATIWMAPEIDEAYLTVTNTYSTDAFLALDEVVGELVP